VPAVAHSRGTSRRNIAMTQRTNPAPASRNRLLARLPDDERRALTALMQHVELGHGQVLYEARGSIDYAYFPAGAVLSALTVMSDGGAIEVATVGGEGMVGHYGYGGRTSPHRVLFQIEGAALRIPAADLQSQAAARGPIRELLSAYHIAFMAQVSQSVACNGLHRLEQRCCRWLLMSRDRVGSDDLRLTHDYLAIMLGARRASVTDALGPLQEAGLVRSHRGTISILDGAGLEARSCECYFVVRDEYDRLLGPPS
jgi:CRP-like cAMP-binding protein